MDEKYNITRSMKPVEVQMAVIIVVGVVLFIFTSQVFRGIDSVMPWDWSGLTKLARWLVFFAIIFGLAVSWLNAKKLTYYATKDSIAIMRGAFGAKNKKVYSVEHITGMGLEQSMFGSKMNYGHISINLSMMSTTEQIRLTNVENPEAVLKKLQQLVKKK